MYEILDNGNIPYAGMNNMEVIERVSEGYRLPKLKDFPDELYELMLQCWNQDPKERPSFSEILKKLNEIRNNLASGMKSDKPPPQEPHYAHIYT